MAKKARKKTSVERVNQTPTASFEEMFPTIARWISQEGGWVEFGADHYSRSLARALHGGGMAWEGSDHYKSLDEALEAMDTGIAAWLDEYRPARMWDRNDKKEQLAASSQKPEPPKKPSTKAPAPPKQADRIKPDQPAPVPRAIAEKVRKLADIAEALRRGEQFQITRLTSLKGLCQDPRAARSFAMFLADRARRWAEEEEATGRVKGMLDKAVTEIGSYLDDPTKEAKEHLHDLLRELEREQDEYRRISWGQVRIVHSRELLVVEKALKSILRDHEAPTWLYHAARDFAERYDSRYGTGLIPTSAPMVQEIADFWREFYSIGR